MNYAVVDVGGTFTKYAVMTDEGEFLRKGKIRVNRIAEIYRDMWVVLLEKSSLTVDDYARFACALTAGGIWEKICPNPPISVFSAA